MMFGTKADTETELANINPPSVPGRCSERVHIYRVPLVIRIGAASVPPSVSALVTDLSRSIPYEAPKRPPTEANEQALEPVNPYRFRNLLNRETPSCEGDLTGYSDQQGRCPRSINDT